LYAYVAVRDASVSMEELRRFLAERLPDYMVPSEIIEVETLPRAGNGKVDRAALPKPQAGTATRTTSPEDVELLKQQDAANMQFEEIVAGIFCQVLQVSHVELDDNFFKLGGHSLLATQVLSRIRKAFGVKLPLRTLFDHPTLRKMSALVRQATHSGQQADLPPITRVEQTEELPLSFAQQRLWFFNQLDPQSPFYNMPLTLRLEGALDVDVLTRSFTRITERHSSLRTVFALRDGQPVQRIQPPQQTAIEVVDLTDSSDAEREAVAISLVTAESRRPFDLTAGPLLRIHLYRLSATSHVLLINMHHIISDGWSNSVLLRELQQLYSSYLRNQEPQLPDVSVQYVDFAVWQRDWMSGELLDEQLRYWTQELSDTPPLLHLPTDRPRPPVQSFRGKTCQHLLKPELSERLQAFSRQQGVTLYMTMLVAFQTMLYRYTGQEDILIGSPIAGRNRAEVEEVIGFFVNTLVLRSKLSGDLTFEKLLKRTRDNTLSAFAHQDLPYEKLVEVLQPERSLAYNPLIQVSFALQNHHGAFSLPNLEITGFATEWSTSKFDLSLIVIPRGVSLLTAFEYNTDLFDEATVQRMLANYAILLEGIVTAPQAKVAALPLLTEQERHQQLVAWNETEVPLLNTTVHERFETVAANLPNNIAVMFGNQEITYRELNERANRLARYLQTHGIEQGDVVGIYLERSAEVVIAILAVLKAGAVYVPLDPAMPRDRLAFQIEDAEVKVLISQSELLEALSFADQRVICLAQEQAQIDTLDGANLLVNMSPEALAYIIYTSGSTGRPKGVMIRHVGVVNLTQAAIKRFDITEKSRVGQFATISFDGSVYQMFVPLHAGAAVCVLTREEQLSVDDFA
ncbi:MAG: condensation domain-containing protein, partial [Tumebacillaceae bacterium]